MYSKVNSLRTNFINFLFPIRIKCSVELFRSRRFELFFQLFMSCSKVCNKLVTFFSKLMLISLTLLILLYFYLYLEWALFFGGDAWRLQGLGDLKHCQIFPIILPNMLFLRNDHAFKMLQLIDKKWSLGTFTVISSNRKWWK